MTHNFERSHWVKESLIGMGTGILFGVTNVVTAHPFDTIKTKMQAEPGFEKLSMIKTAKVVLKSEGIIGLYRGCVPPLWGSGCYRSVQFSVFEGVYTFLDNKFGQYEIPMTHGLQTRVILGGMASGSVRSIIETPLEYAKIRRQTHHNWKLKDSYTGFKITFIRANILMASYFIFLDSFRRNLDTLFRSPFIGPFLASGCSSVLAWWVCWPLEYIKCQIQSGYMSEKNMTIYQRFQFIIRERGGFLGLYRGIAPGSLRSFVGNGFAMVVMQYAQKKVTEWGLRD